MSERKIDLLLFLINKVDYYWNLFYIVNGSIITLLLINRLIIHNCIVLLLLSLIYAGFMIFSYFAHLRAYKFLKFIINDLRHEVSLQDDFPNTYMNLELLSYKRIMDALPYIYTIVGIIIITIFWISDYVR